LFLTEAPGTFLSFYVLREKYQTFLSSANVAEPLRIDAPVAGLGQPCIGCDFGDYGASNDGKA
jgi:hypothetical protein